MKKIIRILVVAVVLIAFLMLIAHHKEQKVTFKKEEVDGVQVSLTYYAKGDAVLKQTSETLIPYSSVVGEMVEKSKELDIVKEMLGDRTRHYRKVKGVKYHLEYGDDAVIEKVEIDFAKVNLEAVHGFRGVAINGESSKISLKWAIKLLEVQGYKEAMPKVL